MFGLCKGVMSMEDIDIVDAIFNKKDPGGVRRKAQWSGVLNR
jgi:hypothetical protein